MQIAQNQISKQYRLYLRKSSPNETTKAGNVVKAEVVEYSFDRPNQFIAILKTVPDPEPFEVFAEKYKSGDIVTVKTVSFDERPGDNLISLVVQEPVSGMEILLEPEKLTFVTRGFATKQIPIGISIQAEVENIDETRRRVVLSCLPLLEAHLNECIAKQRNIEGVFEFDTVAVGEVAQDKLFFVLPWSDPQKGLIHVVSVGGRGLYKSAEEYAVRENCRIRVSLSKNSAHRTIPEIPKEVQSMIETKQREFSSLSWESGSLCYSGRMTNGAKKNLKAPTHDRNFHRAIDDLFRFSNQLLADTIDTQWEERARKYHVGQWLDVQIIRIADFGAFAEIELRLEGLLHKSKMAWGGVVDPSLIVKVGDKVHVVIEKIDFDKQQIGFSMLKSENNPMTKYKAGQRIEVRIVRFADFGAFAEIEPHLEGLIHKSKMAWGGVDDPGSFIRIGDKVNVIIDKIDLEKTQIGFSMLMPEDDPFAKYHVGQKTKGKILRIIPAGLIVELQPGVAGLVHISEVSYNFITSDVLNRLYDIGEEVTVLIISRDMEIRKIGFSIKKV